MNLDEFVDSLPKRGLGSGQVGNLGRVMSLSESFHRDVGTFNFVEKVFREELDSNTVVLLSSDIPGFLPSMSVLKRVFLLDILRKKFEDRGLTSVALFGFSDCELASDPRLYRNRVPACNRDGFVEFGFDVGDENRSKSFHLVDKPSSLEWDFEVERLRNFYMENVRLADIDVGEFERNFLGFSKVLSLCFDQAASFSDLNAFVLSRICNDVFGLKVLFFRHSDVALNGVFSEEYLRLFSNYRVFNSLFNDASGDLLSFRPRGESSLPFRLFCECGVPLPLVLGEFECSCGRSYFVDDVFFRDSIKRIDVDPVARSLVFSLGLGCSLFLSDSLDLDCLRVSSSVAEGLEFDFPIALSVSGRDLYLGVSHGLVLRNLYNAFGLSDSDLLDKSAFESRVSSVISKAYDDFLSSGDREQYEGLLSFYRTELSIARQVFSLRPSCLDLFACLGFEGVGDSFMSLQDVSTSESGVFSSVDASVCYDVDDSFIPKVFDTLSSFKADLV